MWSRLASGEIWAKAIRIVLVFTLVFWASFRVECLAFADLFVDSGEHENEALTGMKLYELQFDGDDPKAGKKLGDTASRSDDPLAEAKLGVGDAMQVVPIASWKQLPGGGDEGGETGGGQGGGTGSGDDENGGSSDSPNSGEGSGGVDDDGTSGAGQGGETPEEEPASEPDSPEADVETRGAPSPIKTQATEDVVSARFVKWTVEGGGSDAVDVNVNGETGIATIEAKAAGTAVVTCSLADGFQGFVADDFQGAFEASFRVTVVSAPYVSSIELYRAPETDGEEPFKPGEEIVLSDDEREAYGFWALVNVYDEAAGETYKYRIGQGDSLSERSGGAFDNLEWAVRSDAGDEVGDDVATITSDGVLSLPGDVPVRVRCTSSAGLNGDPVSQEVLVYSTKAKEDEESQKNDIQGKADPQDRLTVVLNDPAKAADSTTPEGADEEGAGEESAGGEGAEPGSETDVGETQGEQPELPALPNQAESGSSEAPEHAGEAGTDNQGQVLKTFAAGEDGRLVEVLESGDLGEPLALQEETYTMNTASGGTTVVKGRGAFLGELLSRMGLTKEDLARIASIEFVSADSGLHSYDYSEIVAVSRDYIMISTESYVSELDGEKAGGASTGDGAQAQEESADAAAGEEAAGEASGEPAENGQLLDNTRFRILFESSNSSIDPLDLRYVNRITINMQEPEPTEDITDPELSIRIDYVPVPYGNWAFLSAVPNDKVGASRFGYTWEISTDEGKAWSVYSDESVQTLRVMTSNPDDGHIGHWFRVILETDLLDEDGKARGATSEPVKIQASNEFSIVLDYVPDFAGNTAIFTSHLYNAEGISENDVTYVWEYNQGDGWHDIPGADQHSPSWSTPTNAIDESSSDASSGGAATMTYIRVKAIAPGKPEVVSNTQPLTVRVPDSASGGGSKSTDIQDELNKSSGGNDGQNEGDDPDSAGSKTKKTKKKRITEIESPVVEDSPSSMSDYLDGDVTTDPTVAGDMTELVINKDVSATIKEQNAAAKEEAQSKTPGGRWTELSTLNPTEEDLQRIFADNPFAPFTVPLGLGIICAGGLEKLLTFRRQL